MLAGMSIARLLCVTALLHLGCDKAKSDPDVAAEDGVPVADYCEKLVQLGEETAKANGASADPEGPSRDDQIGFCKMMIGNAKKKEPKAYACMADCMMKSKSREKEQACIAERECLAKAKNKKLFSNRAD